MNKPNHAQRIAAARRALTERRAADPEAADRYETRMARLSAAARRARASGADGLWCIVTTSPGRTIPLMRSLRASGFDAWAPVEIRGVRRRGRREMIEREAAIAPSIVFVAAERLSDLLAAAAEPVSPHPPFKIFRHADRVPVIAEVEIERLREVEADHILARRKTVKHRWAKGARIRIEEGPCAGMRGSVVQGDDRSATIDFGLRHSIKIETWLLVADGL